MLPFLSLFAEQRQGTGISSTPAASESEERTQINSNTVIIMASGSGSVFTRFAEEMQQVLDDKEGYSLRVLPLIGNSGEQNMLDLLYLKNIDMGITDDSMMRHFKEMNPTRYKNIETRVQLIAKLLDNELHIVARNEIKSVADLRGKKVNFYQAKSSTAIFAEHLFRILGIAVVPVYYHQDVANRMLKNGEIDAIVRANGAPVPFVQQFKKSDGVHFLAIEPTLKSYDQLLEYYSPAFLKHEDYPELIGEGQSVPTVANATVLASFAWPGNSDRYRKVANFVNRFFDNIDSFMVEPHHPKWREINLAATVPGWQRFKAAEDWLSSHKTRTAAGTSVRDALEKFLAEYKKNNPNSGLDDQQIQVLTVKFFEWWNARKASSTAR
jgi:TRAP transporter TAXI family solute receptor